MFMVGVIHSVHMHVLNDMTRNLLSWVEEVMRLGMRTNRIARWVKLFTAKSEDLSSISGTHMVVEKNCPPEVFL